MKDDMKEPLIKAGILFLLIANMLLLWKVKQSKDKLNSTERVTINWENIVSKSAILKMQNQVFASSDVKVDPNITLVNEVGQQKPLHSTKGEKATLYVRFTGSGCISCIDNLEKEIKIMKDILSENQEKEVVFLTSMNNHLEINVFKSRAGLNCNVFYTEIGSLPFPTEKDLNDITSLYYFILDDSMTTRQFFIPMEGFPDLTETFFETVKQRYFLSL